MSTTALVPAEVLRRYRTALVRIEVDGKNADGRIERRRVGTGMLVDGNGLIITAGHVIGKDENWAETAPGSRKRVRNVKIRWLDERRTERSLGEASVLFHHTHDVAWLQVNPENLPAVELADELPPDDACLVALLWPPDDVPRAVKANLVPTNRAQNPGLTALLQVVEGYSGSGLFDAQYRLAGIIVDRLDDQSARAIPAAWIKSDIPKLSPPRAARGNKEDGDATSLIPVQSEIAKSDQMWAEIDKLRQQVTAVEWEVTWDDRSRDAGWYDLLEVCKEIDQFGDIVQRHRIRRIHGPNTGKIEAVPYEYYAAPKFGTCVLDCITDEQAKWSSPDLPTPETKLKGQLKLHPPATAKQMHAGFTVDSRVINSFAMTEPEAKQRGHHPIEETQVAASFPVRHFRLAFFFPAGYQPTQMRVVARRSEGGLPADQWPEDAKETTRVAPCLFYHQGRGCAVLTIERYCPEYHYTLSWGLPPAPDPPVEEAIRARDQINTLLGLGDNERKEPEATLSSIRDEVWNQFFSLRRDKPRLQLSLLAYDEKLAATRVVLTTDDDRRNDEFPRGVGVAGWVMKRRKPFFVDTQDSRNAGIYKRIEGRPQDRHLLCVPLPLPTFSQRRKELLVNPAMPCLIAALTCTDESGNMGLLKEEPPHPANVESGKLQGAVSSALAERLLDLLSREPLSSGVFNSGNADAGRQVG
jgi:hypothetical protein